MLRTRTAVALLLSLGCASKSGPSTAVPLGGLRVEAQESYTSFSLRGISAVNEKVAWASGARGSWLRTVDGGATWERGGVPGADSIDFRDVHAVNDSTAYLLGIEKPSSIYKTTNGGKTWTRQYADSTSGAFLDCMSFWDPYTGVAVADPIGGRFVLLHTEDGGATWARLPGSRTPPILLNEGAFAASGTCIATAGKSRAWFGTGLGATARVFSSSDSGHTWIARDTKVPAAASTKGIFSIAFRDELTGAFAGGDYQKPRDAYAVGLTSDGGKTWTTTPGPGFFVSGLAWTPTHLPPALFVVGPAGVAWSKDNAATWQRADTTSYNAVAIAPRGRAGWVVGDAGRIARLRW